ncbi:1-acyl-sn-glycerol-3-phosphate acyltransferase [Synechococcus sp. H55.7]|uniref:1-acyl-sn-glycerol-3-phosphate acyltransferase n=1 Tax=unclassified Synechococcus TaxID=2626047 RepID=UPI0039C1F64B
MFSPPPPSFARPPLDFIPLAYKPWVLRLVHGILPLLLRLRVRPWLPSGIAKIEARGVQTLAQLYHQFQAGQIRLILAFRHVEVDDPLVGLYVLSRLVPQAARHQGIPLRKPIHAHFLYDRGMPLWGGRWLGWLLSRLGGIPVHRGRRVDRLALAAARRLLLDGPFPFGIAPEGATNGHSERVNPLEPGTAQLAFWCAEDLAKAGRSEKVVVVPIGIQYRYLKPSWKKLERLLSHLERLSGLTPPADPKPSANRHWAQRICGLAHHLLAQMETFYGLPPLPSGAPFNARLERLLHTALQTAETYFGLSPQGDWNSRCRRIEEAAWTQIYREELRHPGSLAPLQRGLLNWKAQQATLYLQHMRLVESCVAVQEEYLLSRPSFERLAESALILFDVLARLRGDPYPARPRLGWREVQVTVGDPIWVSQRWERQYRQGRQEARQAVAELTQDLQLALERMIS